MVPNIKNVLGTATFRQSLITFFGTAANGALGAVFYIIAARILGPSSFGLLTVTILVLTLVSDIGDLGTDTGLVRFVGKYQKENPEKAKLFLKLGFKVKALVWLFASLIGVVLAPFIAQSLFGKPELIIPLRITFLGVGGVLLFSFITHALQGYQRFLAWSTVQVGTNLLRVLLVLILLYYSSLSLNSTLWVYIGVPLVGFIFGLWFLPNFFKAKNELTVSKEFFRYNKWVALFILLAAFSGRLDTFISARLLSREDLGIYGAAKQLAAIVPQIVTALSTVIAPKMAEMGTVKDLISYLKKTQLFVSGLGILGILTIPAVLFLIPIFFGEAYLGSGPVFVVLLFSQLVYLISVPVHMSIFYYFSYPKLFFYLSLGHLLIITLLGYALIQTYGVIGAAFAVLAGSIFNFVIPFVWVLRKIRREK